MEIGNNRQLPVLAHRPSFPQGLHVLLLEPDVQARTEAESQLRECEYDVTSCSSTAEASTRISNPTSSFDVLLFDVQSMQSKTPDSSVLSAAAKLLPLVLMSASSDSALVYLGVKLGAVDVLEKPLSPLKLKNIWQHTVRRLMSSCGTSAEAQRKHPANVLKRNVHRATLQHLVSEQQAAVEALQLAQQAPVPHLPATQPEPAQGVPVSMPKDVEPVQHLQPFAELQQQDAVQHLAQQQQQMMQLIALSPAHSSGASHGGESGSNASTSDRDHAKLGLDFELEASSFQDAMLLGSSDALTNLLAPLGAVSATAGAHDSMLNLASLLEANTSHAGTAAEAMECDLPAISNTTSNNISAAVQHGATSNSKTLRPRRLHARRHSSPEPSSGAAAAASGSGSGLGGSSAGNEAVLGHSAGQLPPLPNLPGIAWGLPTNPLQICPKNPAAALAGPMAAMMGSLSMGMNMNMGMPMGMPMPMPPVPPPVPGPWGMPMPPPAAAMGMPMPGCGMMPAPMPPCGMLPGLPPMPPAPGMFCPTPSATAMAPVPGLPMPAPAMPMPSSTSALSPQGHGRGMCLGSAPSNASSLMPTTGSSFNLGAGPSTLSMAPSMPSGFSLPACATDPSPRSATVMNGSIALHAGTSGLKLALDDSHDCLPPAAKRADSAPAGLLLHDFDLLLPPLVAADLASLSGSDLMLEGGDLSLDMDNDEPGPAGAVVAAAATAAAVGKTASPFGLQLKKSPSFADFISASLTEVVTCHA